LFGASCWITLNGEALEGEREPVVARGVKQIKGSAWRKEAFQTVS
jgi:hypothetical protein